MAGTSTFNYHPPKGSLLRSGHEGGAGRYKTFRKGAADSTLADSGKRKPFPERLCYGMWLFHLHSTLKIRLFSSVFPLAESIAETFCWLSLWAFKEKSINHFYCTASRKVPFLSRPFCHFTYNYLNC